MNSMSENSSPSDRAKEPYIMAAVRRPSRRHTSPTLSIMTSCSSICSPVLIPRCYLSTVQILVAPHLRNPEDGFGLQQAVLEEVASGDRGPTALVWTASRYVGVTRPETRLPGFEKAVAAARDLGFPVLVRNSGGGAVAANEGSLSFSLTFPVEDLRHGLYDRYTEGVELVAAALRRIGVDAEGGDVEGEFCPGAYSVRSGGQIGRASCRERV